MEASRKRKRDIDYPRITYDVADRTFDRLFKEESLADMKQVVRKKMGYSSDVPLHLAQLRDGKTVDLEDDDDFDAFCAATYAASVIVVRVTVGGPAHSSRPGSPAATSTPSQTDARAFAAQLEEDDVEPSPAVQKSAKKRKISEKVPTREKNAISKDIVPIDSSKTTSELDATPGPAEKEVIEQANPGGEKKRKRKNDPVGAEPPTGDATPESAVDKSSSSVSGKPKKKKAKGADDEAATSGAITVSSGLPKVIVSKLPEDVRVASATPKPEKLKKSKKKSTTTSGPVEVGSDVAGSTDNHLADPLPFAVQLAGVIAQAGEKNKTLMMPQEEPPAKKKRGKNEKVAKAIEHDKSTPEPPPQTENEVAVLEANNTTEDKTSRRKVKSTSSPGEAETPLRKEDPKATLQKIIMARRGITTSSVASKMSTQAPIAPKESESVSVTVKTSKQPKTKVAEAQTNGLHPPATVKTGKRSSGPQSCPICKESPLHLRFQCPVVVQGVKALESRLAELQKDTSEDQSKLIGELKVMIERKRKTRNPKTKVISDDSTTLSGSTKVAKAAAPKAPQSGANVAAAFYSKDLPAPETLPALGSVSYTDLDLEAIIRGPRISLTSADIPSTDTSEDEQEEDGSNGSNADEGLLEDEEVVVKVEYLKKRQSSESSDEEEDDESDNEPVDASRQGSSPPLLDTAASELRHSPQPSESSDNGNRSFLDVDGQGESVEVDNAGDAAFSEALADDNAVFELATDDQPPKAQNAEHHQTDVNSDTAVASQKCEGDSGVPAPIETTATIRNDSIEPAETPEPHEAPHSPITIGSQIPPLQSTPKLSQSMKTRARRLLANSGVDSGPPPITKAMKLLSSIHDGNGPSPQGHEDSVARRTRTATRALSQLPIPPLTARVIKAPLSSQSRRRAQEDEEPEDRESITVVPNSPQLSAKISAKVPSKAPALTKTPAKTSAKAPPKTPAKGLKPVSKAKARGRSKANDVDQEEAKTSEVIINGDESPTPEEEQMSLNTWEVLKDDSSQVDGDVTIAMVDELQSSPSTLTPGQKSTNGRSTTETEHDPVLQEENGLSTTLKEPLFILTESQPGFPYSQWATSHGAESANDSEDEEEVAAVVKPQLARQMASQSFRRLTDITSQQLFQAPITLQPSQPNGSKHVSNDLYGRKGRDSESEESDTESDSDEDLSTHIPKERRAGRLK